MVDHERESIARLASNEGTWLCARRAALPMFAGLDARSPIGPDTVTAIVKIPWGDIDADRDIDMDDLDVILAGRGTPAAQPYDPRDLDGDGLITQLDADALISECT